MGVKFATLRQYLEVYVKVSESGNPYRARHLNQALTHHPSHPTETPTPAGHPITPNDTPFTLSLSKGEGVIDRHLSFRAQRGI